RTRIGRGAHREVGREGAGAGAGREGLRLADGCRATGGSRRVTAEAIIDRPTAVSPFAEAYRAFEEGDGGSAPAAIQSLREAAFRRFAQLGFPTTKNEDWHYTSVAPIVEHDYVHVTTPSGDVRASSLAPFAFGRSDWHTLVFVNGRYAPELSSAKGLPNGVQLLDLQRAWSESPELVERLVAIISY